MPTIPDQTGVEVLDSPIQQLLLPVAPLREAWVVRHDDERGAVLAVYLTQEHEAVVRRVRSRLPVGSS